ncbi:MAG: DUF4157 domain-containing protein, partial [Chloroflexota bacterium]
MAQERALDEKKVKVRQPERSDKPTAMPQTGETGPKASGLISLQQTVGNRAVQRLIAQRSGNGAFELDEETAGRINQARGDGQALDSGVQAQMSASLGYDFGGVRVHTSPEADALNQQLSAKAFTTGQDIFFRSGDYDPGSSGGRELITHELTHVVQQSSGRVGGSGGRMTVNAPGDAFEQEADAIAKQATQAGHEAASADSGVQRQELPEEEEEIQTKALQRQEAPE